MRYRFKGLKDNDWNIDNDEEGSEDINVDKMNSLKITGYNIEEPDDEEFFSGTVTFKDDVKEYELEIEIEEGCISLNTDEVFGDKYNETEITVIDEWFENFVNFIKSTGSTINENKSDELLDDVYPFNCPDYKVLTISEKNAFWLNKLGEYEPTMVDEFLWPAFNRCEDQKEFVRLFIKWYSHKKALFGNDPFSDHFEVFSDDSARLYLFCKVNGEISVDGAAAIFIEREKIYEAYV